MVISSADELARRELAEQEKRLELKLGQVIDLTYWGKKYPKALYTGARATFQSWGDYSSLKMIFEHEGDYSRKPILNSVWIPPKDIILKDGIYISRNGTGISQGNLFPSLMNSGPDKESFIEMLVRLRKYGALIDERRFDGFLDLTDSMVLSRAVG